MRYLRYIVFFLAIASALPAKKTDPMIIMSIKSRVDNDLVTIRAGWHTGLRLGMMCNVYRSSEKIGDLLLVGLDEDVAVGVIMHLVSGKAVQNGDTVSVKISHNSYLDS